MSQMTPASDALQAAVDALRAEVEDRPRNTATETTVPLLSYLTLGHLATLLAAVSTPTLDLLPAGAVEVEEEAYRKGMREDHVRALVTVYNAPGKYVHERFFLTPAVSE